MPKKKPNNSKQVNIHIDDVHDVSGEVNVAGGHIIHADIGATVIIGAPAKAINGLLALRDLMQRSSDVHSAVITFQVDFKVAHEQVNRLGDYKDLHDLLHHLQFHCYNGIVQAVTRFPNDELMLDNLIDYALTLEEIGEELKQFATQSLMPKQELIWIEDIYLAKVDLSNAIDTLNEKLLRSVVWRLNRLLSTQPARINTLLNHSARALRLPSLLSALIRICDYLISLNLETAKVKAFQVGVDALGKLDTALNSLVDSHDRWQALDIELRRIEASINQDLTELEMSWPDVKLQAESLYMTYSDEWANAMKNESTALEDALHNNNPLKVRRSLRSYQRRANDRFYRVDLELKVLCDDLRQIGIPLASVLEMIE